MKKAATLLILVFLIAPLFVVTSTPNFSGVTSEDKISVQNNVPLNIFQETSDIQRDIRVALYDEPNITQTSYSYSGLWTTNVTEIEILLVNAGFAVTRLTAGEIDGNDTLRTALFDVFVMVDNTPRESITDEVLNFWRGGGGILSFDGAISFLCYFGVMVPNSVGDHGHGSYWTYQWSTNHTVASRHPVVGEVMIGNKYVDYLDWATFDWSSLQGFSYSSEYTKITVTDTGDNWVSTLARDTVNGGRVVHTFGDCNPIAEYHDQMIIDAINWLCPRPIARVVFDYSHRPYYGIDVGDPDLGYNLDPRYYQWREALVNRSYTVDKLYKSPEGNLTADNLAPYDVLIIAAPLWNFTTAEIATVTNWVAEGGGLILLGEQQTFIEENANVNYLLTGFGGSMSLHNVNYPGSSFSTSDSEMHPTLEYVSTIHMEGGVYVNITGDAYALWYNGPNIVCAAQEYGAGRVFLAGDINFLGQYIGNDDNEQYAINLINWLSSGAAPVLLYVDEPDSVNYYRTPVAQALNELGVDYYVTTTGAFLNLSISLQPWYLVIVDNPWWGLGSWYSDFRDYIATGGRFLMSGYQVDNNAASPLWSMLGFEFAAELGDSPMLYKWQESAPIFNGPHHYWYSNFTPVVDYGDEGDFLTVFSNATALAGFTNTTQAGNASIVARNDGKTLYNAYLIDEFTNDLDDSTYADNYELWMNEIAYMLRVSINEPADVEYVEGTTGHNIVWAPHSVYPVEYLIEMDGSPAEHAPWDGGPIIFDIDGLANGTYVFVIEVVDIAGYTAADEVIVTVTAAVTTPTTTTTVPPPAPIDPILVIVIVAVAGVALILILVIMKKRSSK